ncbi:MAG: S8 family serine peptidase [Crocinitomicaceae bacterium]|nr:S8 family serine peptidase [Crocinitomicaceae bacterium]
MKIKLHLILVISFFVNNDFNAQDFNQEIVQFNSHTYHKIDNKWNAFDSTSNHFYEVNLNSLSIKYNLGLSKLQIENFESTHNLSFLRKNIFGWVYYSVELNSNNLFTQANLLLQSSIVEKIEITSFGEYLMTPNDPSYGQQWYLDKIRLPEAWEINAGSEDITVAVIDGGLDWRINDLGIGNDQYQNIYLNNGEDEWTNVNNPATGDSIDSDSNGFMDDWKGYDFGMPSNSTLTTNYHGTRVASIISSKSNNTYGIAGVAGGWNSPGCKILGISINNINNLPDQSLLADAITYAVDQGAKVINISVGVQPAIDINTAIDYAYENGVIIVAASGNENHANAVVYPANHPKIIGVGSSNELDFKANHSNYGSLLDIVAPGEGILTIDPFNTIQAFNATSFASPIAAGVVALMLSENPCLKTQMIHEILKATAVKSGGYNYDWNYLKPGHSKEMGYGRIDAYKAVKAAQLLYSSTPDLYIRDHISDIGTDAGYQFTWDFDESPDIWVRNINDGFVNQVPEEIEFDGGNQRYIYIRIGNASCVPTSGNEKLKIYATAAGSTSKWTEGWTMIGDSGGQVIGEILVPVIPPGERIILEVPWNMIYSVNTCIMARIEESIDDPITLYPSSLPDEIYFNNNIALRNVVIYNVYPGREPHLFYDKVIDHGSEINIRNPKNEAHNYDFHFFTNHYSNEKPITQSAELKIYFSSNAWRYFKDALVNRNDVKILEEKIIKVLNSEFIIPNVLLPANFDEPLFIGINFLTDEIDDQRSFPYHFCQKFSDSTSSTGVDRWVGGVHFHINRNERLPFDAKVEGDKNISIGETLTLIAENISEYATYNWYNEAGELVFIGTDYIISPELSSKYKLEVISKLDGFKDYTDIDVNVNPFVINSISPNPVSSFVDITYIAKNASSASFILAGVNNSSILSTYSISPLEQNKQLDLSNLPTGVYSLILVCDGELVAVKNFIKN